MSWGSGWMGTSEIDAPSGRVLVVPPTLESSGPMVPQVSLHTGSSLPGTQGLLGERRKEAASQLISRSIKRPPGRGCGQTLVCVQDDLMLSLHHRAPSPGMLSSQ